MPAERARANDLEAEQRTVHTKLTVYLGARDERPFVLAAGGTLLGVALLTRHELGVMAAPIGAWRSRGRTEPGC